MRRLVLRLRSGEERERRARGRPPRRPTPTLVSFAGVTSRPVAAEPFKGATVLVHREDLPPPAEGEWFQGDLVGLEARTPEGAPLGRVTEVWNTGPVPIW